MFKTIAYFPSQCANGSSTVMDTFLAGCRKMGITPVENSMDADCAVVWSVVLKGRMAANKSVLDRFDTVFILEVGSLKRGLTWKLAANQLNNTGNYGIGLVDRSHLGIQLTESSGESILIALQHQCSLLWDTGISSRDWAIAQIESIRKYHDNPIIVRPHPRDPIRPIDGVLMENPLMVPDTYCEYDLSFDYKFVVNHSSGVGIQAGIAGVPLITGASSMCRPIGSTYDNIERVDRTRWFSDILHTEWLIDELETGIPLKRILDNMREN